MTGLLVPVATADAGRRALGSRTLKQPMRGTDVRVLQDFLTQLGWETKVDGQFGPTTTRNVKAWERSKDIRPDGKVTVSDSRVMRADVELAQTAAPEAVTPGEDPTVERTASNPSSGGATIQPPPEKATIVDGLAVAPASAPQQVKDFIAAANKIAKTPYKYGGGHGKWEDDGYDCSGSMSYALHGAGLLDESSDSTGFMSYGEAGPGTWMTLYAHGGHSYMMVAGLRFDTSGRREDGTRWHTSKRSADGFTVRHPPGL